MRGGCFLEEAGAFDERIIYWRSLTSQIWNVKFRSERRPLKGHQIYYHGKWWMPYNNKSHRKSESVSETSQKCFDSLVQAQRKLLACTWFSGSHVTHSAWQCANLEAAPPLFCDSPRRPEGWSDSWPEVRSRPAGWKWEAARCGSEWASGNWATVKDENSRVALVEKKSNHQKFLVGRLLCRQL